MTSRRNAPMIRVASPSLRPGCGRSRPRNRRNPATSARASASRHWRADWRSSAARPAAPALRSRASAGPRRRTILRPVALHPVFEQFDMLGLAPCRRSAPGGRASSLRPSTRRPFWARSSPWGCAARSSAIAGRRSSRRRAPPPGSPRSRRLPGRASPPSADASAAGRRPRQNAACSHSRATALRVARAGCGRGSSGWRSCSRSDAGSAAPRRRSPGLGICCRARRRRTARFRPRRRRSRRRRSDRDCRRRRHRRATAHSRVRRLR